MIASGRGQRSSRKAAQWPPAEGPRTNQKAPREAGSRRTLRESEESRERLFGLLDAELLDAVVGLLVAYENGDLEDLAAGI